MKVSNAMTIKTYSAVLIIILNNSKKHHLIYFHYYILHIRNILYPCSVFIKY